MEFRKTRGSILGALWPGGWFGLLERMSEGAVAAPGFFPGKTGTGAGSS